MPRRVARYALSRDSRDVDDEALAHIWPTHHENVHFYGPHSVDIDGELAQLDTTATGRCGWPPASAVSS
ncbi:hypothetical protein AB0C44_27935 [Micromonospora taraxaci]|uniref:hypothetical protein n=1 Tax=Micromonospora taraxaci TaxID=1316803 RepID=UPI0033C12F46